MIVTIAELRQFHEAHLSEVIPEINFDDDDDDESAKAEGNEMDVSPQPSFQITDLVNDYYNLKPATNAELTDSQRAYLAFKEEHMRKFNEEYKPERVTHHEETKEDDEYEELDY